MQQARRNASFIRTRTGRACEGGRRSADATGREAAMQPQMRPRQGARPPSAGAMGARQAGGAIPLE